MYKNYFILIFLFTNTFTQEIPEEPHPDKQITEVKRISSITITEPIFKEIASKVNAIRADLVK